MLGYWQDEAATAEAIRDGWLHTGDLGELDADGFLTIRGRKKELIVLSTGKKVSPTRVESLLTASPLIEQAAVFGEGRAGLVALVVPARARGEKRAARSWRRKSNGAWRRRRRKSKCAVRGAGAAVFDRARRADAEDEFVSRGD